MEKGYVHSVTLESADGCLFPVTWLLRWPNSTKVHRVSTQPCFSLSHLCSEGQAWLGQALDCLKA